MRLGYRDPDMLMFRGYAIQPNGDIQEFIRGPLAIASPGNPIPFTVPLRPKAPYDLEIPMSKWNGKSSRGPLTQDLIRTSQVRITLDRFDCFVPHDRHFLEHWPDPTFATEMLLAKDWKCWQGKIT